MESIAFDKINLLIIDDDQFMIDLVKTSVTNLGIKEIKTALNGKVALALIDDESNAFNLLLCDLNMPEMDGAELMRHLASRNYSGDIILFSGEDKRVLEISEQLAKKHNLNVLGVLEKPLDIEKFKALLAKEKDNLKKENKKGGIIPDDLGPKDLEKGIDNQELILYYQPQIDVKTKKIIGFESLIRWKHPEYGIIGPDIFIPIAEENQLIRKLTESSLEQAIEQMHKLQPIDGKIKIALNLSALLLADLDLTDYITAKIKGAELSPKNFVIEITESRLMQNLASELENITRFSLNQFALSIDDFGTGYSSMQQLQQLPFTEIKIDKSFVQDAEDRPCAKAILEASAQLAKKLDLLSVAEGVETQRDWDLVESVGVDVVQGYFIAKPMAPDEALQWTQEWKV
ncbi:MAG: EAL domain-containing protein [Gammaproteobacteria bacterium]